MDEAKMRNYQKGNGLSAHQVLEQHLTNVPTVTANVIRAALAEYQILLATLVQQADSPTATVDGKPLPVITVEDSKMVINSLMLLANLETAVGNSVKGLLTIQDQLQLIVQKVWAGEAELR